jgi:ADP-ribosylglycohydrolase
MRPVSDSGIGNTPAQPRTPTGVTGALAGAAAIAADVDGTRAQDAASQAEQRTVSARRALTESQQLVELQQQNNMLLSRIVEQNGMITGDTRKQVDLLENINNKT